MPPPPLVRGRGKSLAREGMGESQFRRGDIHCGTLYICTLWGKLLKILNVRGHSIDTGFIFGKRTVLLPVRNFCSENITNDSIVQLIMTIQNEKLEKFRNSNAVWPKINHSKLRRTFSKHSLCPAK